MLLGDELWQMNDFYSIRPYYEAHNELILIDEASKSGKGGEYIGFPKKNIVRMVAKPRVLDEIVDYVI